MNCADPVWLVLGAFAVFAVGFVVGMVQE